MNFRFFAFGMSALFGLVVCMVILTMIGSQFLTKDQLSVLIEPTFFFGFVVIGFFYCAKSIAQQIYSFNGLSAYSCCIYGIIFRCCKTSSDKFMEVFRIKFCTDASWNRLTFSFKTF